MNMKNITNLAEYRKLREEVEEPKKALKMMLAIIYQACLDGDVEWFQSEHSDWYFEMIPDSLLQTFGIDTENTSVLDIKLQIINNIHKGMYRIIETETVL